MNPKYPIYIISKGRYDRCLTAKQLDLMNVPYRIVVEPVEYDKYAAVINKNKILTLPFSDLGQGSIPARNWVWEYSISEGHKRHWILDDNIDGFYRLNRNMRVKVTSGTIFKLAEDFTERYTNVPMSGLNYRYFCIPTQSMTPFYLNTRVYSCILLKNDLKFRWRGRYNEDTDLSLRILKDGYCTILFNAFLASKVCTMQMKGGNTDTVYIDGDNRLKFAKALEELHPDIVRVTWKYNRWHHQVNYSMFKSNRLIRRDDLVLENKINNYGMKLIELE